MAKYQLFNILLFITLFYVFVDISLAGKTERFILISIRSVGPKNEWIEVLEISIHDEIYVSVSVRVMKRFPLNALIETFITYNNESLPKHEMLLCDSFKELLFGKQVKERGYPQPGFPDRCPFGPYENIKIKDWYYDCENIPAGTPPGPVFVKIIFSIGNETVLVIEAEGKIVQDLYSMDEVKTPSLG